PEIGSEPELEQEQLGVVGFDGRAVQAPDIVPRASDSPAGAGFDEAAPEIPREMPQIEPAHHGRLEGGVDEALGREIMTSQAEIEIEVATIMDAAPRRCPKESWFHRQRQPLVLRVETEPAARRDANRADP